MPRLPGLLVLRLTLRPIDAGLCVVDPALRGADRLSRELGGAVLWATVLCGVRR